MGLSDEDDFYKTTEKMNGIGKLDETQHATREPLHAARSKQHAKRCTQHATSLTLCDRKKGVKLEA